MTDKEILLDVLDDFAGTLWWTVHKLSPDALCWQPDDEANNIGVTVWHICRSFDVLAVRALQNRSYAEEAWYAYGWADKTGYDPHGVGFCGWGTLARYTQEEVAAIPPLSANELLLYFEQVKEVLNTYIESMSTKSLYQPPPGWPDSSQTTYQPETAYQCIRAILMDTREHLGEIKAIKAMWERKNL